MAEELNRWILRNDSGNVLVALNGLQIRFRLGTLSAEDYEFIDTTWKAARRMEYGDDSLYAELAASILAGRIGGVNDLLGLMPHEARAAFEEAPIMFLFHLRGAYEIGEPNNASEWRRIEDEIENELVKEVALYCSGMPTSVSQN